MSYNRMTYGRTDPGDCPICGAGHCACGGGGPITVVQLPARDAARASTAQPLGTLATPAGEGAAGDSAPFGDGTDGRPFTTATYRGKKGRK